MYNKLFTKILDSSIWLQEVETRIVWLTLLASMDEDGYCHFAAAANLAHRARVSVESTKKALEVLEGPDEDSADKSHDGRRIERVPGGWLVLNATKHRELVTKDAQREQTRNRVRKHRERNALVTPCNGHSVTCNTSDALALAEADPSQRDPGVSDLQVENGNRKISRKTRGDVLVKLAHTILDEHPGQPESEQSAVLKSKASQAGIPYTGRTAAKALETALQQRRQ